MSGPLRVSVALCTHNGAIYIEEQLRSILGQSVLPDEIVVSDDASTDGTLEIVHAAWARWATGATTLRVLRNDSPLGVIKNFEQALKASTGDLISLCDQDDRWKSDRLEKIIAHFASRPDLRLLFSDARLVDEAGAPLGGSLFEALEIDTAALTALRSSCAFPTLLRRNLVTGATTVIRRELLDAAVPFEPSWVHDEWLAIIAAATSTIDWLPDQLVDYRQHGGNQIGARAPTLAYKVRRVIEPRGDRHQVLELRAAALLSRLSDLGADQHLLDLAERKLSHERFRAALPAPRFKRIGPVLARGTAEYQRFSSQGRLDMVRDLLQPDRWPRPADLPPEPAATPRHHVAFIVNNYPPHRGGVERHVHALATHLTRLGIACTVITLSDDPSVIDEKGIAVIRLPHWLKVGSILSFPLPGASRRIARELRRRNVTIVSTHTRFFPMSYVGARVARRLRLPTIHTEHGSGFVAGVSPLIGLASKVVDLTMGRAVLRSATMVVAVSEAVGLFVRKLAGKNSRLMHNAVDLTEWRDVPSPLADKPRFVFLGRLVPGKGWDTLLDAAAGLRATHGEFEFEVDFIGDGPDRWRLAQEVARRNLGDIVALHGHVDGVDLRKLLSGSILVNPTTLSEGFQTSLIEALACGASIVTFDVPGAAALQADGAPLWMVPRRSATELADAMRAAAEHPRSAFAPERLELWGWESRVREYVDLLDEATRGPGV